MHIHTVRIASLLKSQNLPIEKPCGDDFVIIIGGLHIEKAGLGLGGGPHSSQGGIRGCAHPPPDTSQLAHCSCEEADIRMNLHLAGGAL